MEKGNELKSHKSHRNSAPEVFMGEGQPERTLRLELLPAPVLRGHTTPPTHSSAPQRNWLVDSLVRGSPSVMQTPPHSVGDATGSPGAEMAPRSYPTLG